MKPINGLYHKDIFLPVNVSGTFVLKYSNHAMKASNSDKYGKMILPDSISINKSNVIEAEIESGRIVKLVVRISYNSTLDMIIVFLPLCKNLVKTVWYNLKSDNHETLKRYNYVTKADIMR